MLLLVTLILKNVHPILKIPPIFLLELEMNTFLALVQIVWRRHIKELTFFVPCTTLGSQPTIDVKWLKIEEVAYESIVDGGMMQTFPSNATNFAYYQPMIDVIASCEPGFKGPSFHDIKEVQRIDKYLSSSNHGPKQGVQLCPMDKLMADPTPF